MRRRNVRGGSSEINLDSLLDILSNVVGVMVLLAVMTVLSSQNIQLSLGTPLLRDPPAGSEPLKFEVRGNHLYQIDERVMEERRKTAFHRYRQETGGEPFGRLRSVVYDKYDIGDTNYRVKFEWAGGRNNYIYQPRSDAVGDSISELAAGQSRFEALLKRQNPKNYYLSFIVRDDSFEAYNAAKRIAEKYGFATGWEPIGSSEADRLIFNAEGNLGTRIQ